MGHYVLAYGHTYGHIYVLYGHHLVHGPTCGLRPTLRPYATGVAYSQAIKLQMAYGMAAYGQHSAIGPLPTAGYIVLLGPCHRP